MKRTTSLRNFCFSIARFTTAIAISLALSLSLVGCFWEKLSEKDPNRNEENGQDEQESPVSPLSPLPEDPNFPNTPDPSHTPRY